MLFSLFFSLLIFFVALSRGTQLALYLYHTDLDMLERERDFRLAEIRRKREALRELMVQQVCFRNLVQHNKRREELQQQQQQQQQTNGNNGVNGNGETMTTAAMAAPIIIAPHKNKIPLPFIVMNTSSSTIIQCNMSRDLSQVMFDMNQPFEINDDNTILRRLGLHRVGSVDALRDLFPPPMIEYCERHGMLDDVVVPPPPPSAVPTVTSSSTLKQK